MRGRLLIVSLLLLAGSMNLHAQDHPVSVLDGPVVKTDTVRRKPPLLPWMGYEEVVLTYSPENAFPLNPDVVLKIDPTLLDYVIIEDPSPTPVRRVEPPTFVANQEINLAEETKPGSLFTVGTADIPHEVEYITLYTQIGKGGIFYPYVIRFGDEAGLSIQKKQAKKVFKRIKRTPVESIQFEGFELVSVGDMADDAAAQNASAVVKAHGLHDYGNRNTPVYYFERKE